MIDLRWLDSTAADDAPIARISEPGKDATGGGMLNRGPLGGAALRFNGLNPMRSSAKGMYFNRAPSGWGTSHAC